MLRRGNKNEILVYGKINPLLPHQTMIALRYVAILTAIKRKSFF